MQPTVAEVVVSRAVWQVPSEIELLHRSAGPLAVVSPRWTTTSPDHRPRRDAPTTPAGRRGLLMSEQPACQELLEHPDGTG